MAEECLLQFFYRDVAVLIDNLSKPPPPFACTHCLQLAKTTIECTVCGQMFHKKCTQSACRTNVQRFMSMMNAQCANCTPHLQSCVLCNKPLLKNHKCL